MGKICVDGWKEFKISDIFFTIMKGNKIQVPTGANIPLKELVENGSIPRITVTGVNNGVFGYFDYKGDKSKDYRVFNNFISVSFLGTVFYHSGDASLDMKVHCLKPMAIELNEDIGQYLVGVVKASLRESSYADQISSTALPDMPIRLPVDGDGNPNWKYMEDYIINLKKIVDNTITNLQIINDLQAENIDVVNYKRFHLYDDELFTIDGGTKLDKVKMSNVCPSINFVGRANTNNGVTDFVDKIDAIEPYQAGLMTISLGGEYLGSCFIQDMPFYTSQNVNVLIPKQEMSYYCKQFIATMIFKEGRIHYKAFIDELNRHMKTDFSIPLPVDEKGNINWKFMNNYMKSVENKIVQTIECYGYVKDC